MRERGGALGRWTGRGASASRVEERDGERMNSYPPQQPPNPPPSGPPPYSAPPSYGQQPQPPYNPYGQPQYNPYAQPAYATPTTNGMAIAAIICGFLVAPLGLIFGIISLNQINKSGGMQKGKGLAITGIVLGGLWVAFILLLIILGAVAAGTSTSP